MPRWDDPKIQKLLRAGISLEEAMSRYNDETSLQQLLSAPSGAIPTYTNATKPAATGSGEIIFVSDDNLGTLYKDVAAGSWLKLSGSVGDSGGRELAYLSLATGIAAANTPDSAWHDIAGHQIAFTGGVRPIKVRSSLMFQIGLGSAGSGSLRRLSLGLVDAAGAGTIRDQSPWTSTISTGNVFLARLICEYRFQPVQGQAYTFKSQQQTNVAGLSISIFGEDLGVESFIEAVEH